MRLFNLEEMKTADFKQLFEKEGPVIFILSICPGQTYFPKISSRLLDNGSMESNPLHDMSPSLSAETTKMVFKYIDPPIAGS